jgi:hypothetical protein
MLTTPTRGITLPAGTLERLEIPAVHVGGYPDPTELPIETQLTADAASPTQGDAVDPDGWQPATWADTTTIRTHLLGGTPGTYGLWVRITAADEVVIRYAGRIHLT